MISGEAEQSFSLISRQRIMNELKNIKEQEPEWKVITNEEKMTEWKIILTLNDRSTPFHSFPIEILVSFPNNYPENVPVFRMAEPKRFFHPNINKTDGRICDANLKKQGKTITIRERMDGIIHLLYVPNETDPWNGAAADTILKEGFNAYYFKALVAFRQY